jgi:hypothetical protein
VCVFSACCAKKWALSTRLLFHTEVHWLLKGNVLKRVFVLRDEVKTFLHDSDDINKDLFHASKWLDPVAYLSNIFNILNSLSLSLQG